MCIIVTRLRQTDENQKYLILLQCCVVCGIEFWENHWARAM